MTARILIVEDEEPLTLLLRYNLEAEGYSRRVARCAATRRDLKLKENTPDLVLLDWMLPGLSGIESDPPAARAPAKRPALPIIMLTARGEETERVRGLATGADDYVVKPFSVPELLARIRAAAAPHQARARRRRAARRGDIELDRETQARRPRRPRRASRARPSSACSNS